MSWNWKMFKQALRHQGPSYEPSGNFRVPKRDDDVARWLRYQRDANSSEGPIWRVFDQLLASYKLHADTRTPLNEHACDYFCDCEGKERVRWQHGE